MPYVDAIGAKLYFEESDYGYPIIFVHEFRIGYRGGKPRFAIFPQLPLHRLNARGYPPSDVPEDAALYGWSSRWTTSGVDGGLLRSNAPWVGLSMGGYAALPVGCDIPEKPARLSRRAVGSGFSLPSVTPGWGNVCSGAVFTELGMGAMAREG